jgi:hypothetical protein
MNREYRLPILGILKHLFQVLFQIWIKIDVNFIRSEMGFKWNNCYSELVKLFRVIVRKTVKNGLINSLVGCWLVVNIVLLIHRLSVNLGHLWILSH